jgi:hypothetical protein
MLAHKGPNVLLPGQGACVRTIAKKSDGRESVAIDESDLKKRTWGGCD